MDYREALQRGLQEEALPRRKVEGQHLVDRKESRIECVRVEPPGLGELLNRRSSKDELDEVRIGIWISLRSRLQMVEPHETQRSESLQPPAGLFQHLAPQRFLQRLSRFPAPAG